MEKESKSVRQFELELYAKDIDNIIKVAFLTALYILEDIGATYSKDLAELISADIAKAMNDSSITKNIIFDIVKKSMKYVDYEGSGCTELVYESLHVLDIIDIIQNNECD